MPRKTETIKQRRVDVYAPTLESKGRWPAAAKEKNIPLSKYAGPDDLGSVYEGAQYVGSIPWPNDAPLEARYLAFGYGEIGESTLPITKGYLMGDEPMPVRSDEDRLYELTEQL